ncbi:RICIN domain-containing protein [Tranquillimonas alkanivorans]|uniref:Uncharacterized protein n=1 Tax=Tranquillimonas alkanivorans TaxID=441119 RepID=A0A1I5T5F3_9RHOB|nr:RICIN domain-containing protein [Tranquillimonas alkanivorans]SFP77897.1 hypothetical protein SAMN04488047_112144 [Tranquillimonas alkanivorans]
MKGIGIACLLLVLSAATAGAQVADGTYDIRADDGAVCLQASPPDGDAPPQTVSVAVCDRGAGQAWTAVQASGGYVRLMAEPGLCLDGNDPGEAARAGAAFLAPCAEAGTQLWEAVSAADDAVRLKTRFGGGYLCLRRNPDAQVHAGAPFMSRCRDGARQLWRLVPRMAEEEEAGAMSPPRAEPGVPASCRVSIGPRAYTGPCRFLRDRSRDDGSFALRASDGGALFDGIADLAVEVAAPGRGTLRAYLSDGTPRDLGPVTRTGACWTGAEATVCTGAARPSPEPRTSGSTCYVAGDLVGRLDGTCILGKHGNPPTRRSRRLSIGGLVVID